jgi:excisionase family DNA binding protein
VQQEQPDAGKSKFLGASLVYMERTDGERREPLLSVRQAAVLLGLCTATVYEHCARGNLRHVRVASAIRIASAALEEFVELRSAPQERKRQPVLSLPPASTPRSLDETPDSSMSRRVGEEPSTSSALPDDDA